MMNCEVRYGLAHRMVIGKYGNYEWRNYVDTFVIGWRSIENTT